MSCTLFNAVLTGLDCCLQLCWVLYCDIMCLDYDGNLLDACVTSLLAALKNSTCCQTHYYWCPYSYTSEKTKLIWPCSRQLNSQRSPSMQRRARPSWIWIKDKGWKSTGILLLHPFASLMGEFKTFRFWPGLNHVQCFMNLVDFPCSSILIVDPSAEEESLSTARLTVVTDEGDRLCAVHKPGQSKM